MKTCKSGYRKRQKIEEIAERQETEESDTDKSIDKIFEKKHVADRKSDNNIKRNWQNRKRILRGHGITGHTNITGYRNNKRQEKITDNQKKYQDFNKNEVQFAEKLR